MCCGNQVLQFTDGKQQSVHHLVLAYSNVDIYIVRSQNNENILMEKTLDLK